MKIKFTKMQAFGNDYVYIYTEENPVVDYNHLSKKISDRHFGVGSDGMVLICPSRRCDFRMRIFNPDGTEAQMCGNALRSTAMFAYHHGLTTKEILTIETLGGDQIVKLTVEDDKVVNIHAAIGKPELRAKLIPVISDQEDFLLQPRQVLDQVFELSSMSWGNPHTVLYVDDLSILDIEKYGPAIEHHPSFPERTNVTFAQLVDDSHIKIREWERGTGETLGCGTGCCAAVVISHTLGKCGRRVTVTQPGGDLQVEWDAEGIVHMRGPSHVVFQGEYFYEAE